MLDAKYVLCDHFAQLFLLFLVFFIKVARKFLPLRDEINNIDEVLPLKLAASEVKLQALDVRVQIRLLITLRSVLVL